MKQTVLLFLFFMLISCQNKKENKPLSEPSFDFFVGTYTNGESEGIYKYILKEDGTIDKIGLAAKSENPSFLSLSKDKKYLLAVNEINTVDGKGTVESFLIKDDQLSAISKQSSGGAHPCFVTSNKFGYVLTANYTSGNIGLLKLDNKGQLSGLLDVQQHTGKGTTDRQKSPHAHSAWFDFDALNIISIDLGTNELWFYKLDTIQQKLIPNLPKKLLMTPGAGPRHLAFHPNKKWVYVVNELNSSVTLIQKNKEGNYHKSNSFSTLPLGYNNPNACADIHISKDGKFLYASNRGHNSIAIFKINNSNGDLKLIANEPTLGNGPRNFSLSPNENYIVVANQLTNNMVSFKRDKKSGLLKYVDQINAPSPVCILFD